MCAIKDDQSVVIDREPDQKKNLDPSGPRIRCPLCGWSPHSEWYAQSEAAGNAFMVASGPWRLRLEQK
jgi:hypothetical protein